MVCSKQINRESGDEKTFAYTYREAFMLEPAHEQEKNELNKYH